jgi:YVTN family beta-propeller protein
VGYNIYYGSHSDQINNKLSASFITNQINGVWEFTGTIQNSGKEYYFAVEAYDDDDLTSLLSDPVIVIPVGDIKGYVQLEDESSHENVTISLAGTTIMAQSLHDGSFFIAAVHEGTYTITAYKHGYALDQYAILSVIPGQIINLSQPLLLNKPPEPATGLEVNYISISQVKLTWNQSVSSDVIGYNVYQGTHKDTINNKVNESLITQTSESLCGYTAQVNFTGIAYYFAIEAIDDDGLSSILSDYAPTVPVGEISGKVLLDESSSHGNVNISIDGTSITAQSVGNGSFLLSPVPEGTYTITAYKEGFTPETITDLTVVPGKMLELPEQISLNSPPQVPTGVTLSYQKDLSVLVMWQPSVSTDVKGYHIYYGASADQIDRKANPELISETVENVWKYSVTMSPPTEIWYLAVKAQDQDGLLSELSVHAQTNPVGEIEGHVTLEGTSYHDNVTVSVDGTTISAQTVSDGYFLLSQIPAGEYTITAYKAGYKTDYIAGIQVNPGQKTSHIMRLCTPPIQPTGLKASQISGSSIKVEWISSLSTDVKGYTIYFSTRSDLIDQISNQKLITEMVDEKWQYTITGLNKGITYYFAAMAVDEDHLTSPLSQYVQKVIAPGQPVPPDVSDIMDWGFPIKYPEDICISRDGQRAYVTNPYNQIVSLIDLASSEVIGTINVGSNPTDLVRNPMRDEVYSVNTYSNNVTIIDSTQTDPSQAVIGTLSTPDIPVRALVSPDGNYLFVACEYDMAEKIRIIDLDTRNEIDDSPISMRSAPRGMAIANNKLYVAEERKNAVSLIDIDPNSPSRWQKFQYSIPVQDSPLDVAESPDGQHIYVINSGSATISIINTSSDTVVNTLSVGNNPYGMAVSDNLLYVTNQSDGNVSMINMDTMSVLETSFSTGMYPRGIAVSNDGEKIYVVNYGSESVSIRGY